MVSSLIDGVEDHFFLRRFNILRNSSITIAHNKLLMFMRTPLVSRAGFGPALVIIQDKILRFIPTGAGNSVVWGICYQANVSIYAPE